MDQGPGDRLRGLSSRLSAHSPRRSERLRSRRGRWRRRTRAPSGRKTPWPRRTIGRRVVVGDGLAGVDEGAAGAASGDEVVQFRRRWRRVASSMSCMPSRNLATADEEVAVEGSSEHLEVEDAQLHGPAPAPRRGAGAVGDVSSASIENKPDSSAASRALGRLIAGYEALGALQPAAGDGNSRLEVERSRGRGGWRRGQRRGGCRASR